MFSHCDTCHIGWKVSALCLEGFYDKGNNHVFII